MKKLISIFAIVFLVFAMGLQAQELPALAPLFDYPVRDTCVCLGPDGTYYLTGTTGYPTWWGDNDGIRMWKSTDLKTWTAMGLVWSFASNTTWQNTPAAIWAPEIHYINGTFWITYSMNYGGTGILKSSSGKPEGPYGDIKTNGSLTSDIDASLFQDDDGRVYFVYQNGRIARMNDDMSGLAEAPRLLSPGNNGEVGFEGAFITKLGSKYLLVCAAFNSDSGSQTYDCMVASSTNIYGPYGDRYLAIRHGGHNMLFADAVGNWWSTFFGNDDTSPFRERPAILRVTMNAQGKILPLGQVAANTGTNFSFETPVTADYTTSIAGWSVAGGGFTALINNSGPHGGLSGIDSNQFGDIDGNVAGARLFQDLTTQYTVGYSYTLAVDVATRPDAKVSSTATLRLQLRDSFNHLAAYTDVPGTTVLAAGNAVTTITVNVPAVQSGDAWANQPIRITLEDTVASGGGSDWVVDNVRLTEMSAQLSVMVGSPTNAQVFVQGTSISATATVVSGTSPYTVSIYTNYGAGAYALAGSVTAPFAVSLGTLATGTYGICAVVTDATNATAISATNTFTVVPPIAGVPAGQSVAVTFTNNSTWKAPNGVTAIELLVVAGGGGGGDNGACGGGGAGGLIYYGSGSPAVAASYSVTPGSNYTVTVGAGGAIHGSGSNSSFGAVVAIGGGYGGQRWSEAGGVGGSGGGASILPWGTIANGAAGTSGQGNAGGGSMETNGQQYAVGGGGGGAGTAGSKGQLVGIVGAGGTLGYAGNGGDGLPYSISGTTVTYAGGGGGSEIEQGANGQGGVGYLNPGGGGMAVFPSGTTGGQNGIVILRYTPPASGTLIVLY